MHYMSFFRVSEGLCTCGVYWDKAEGGGDIHKSYYMRRGNVGDNVFLGFAIQLGVCCWSDLNASKRFRRVDIFVFWFYFERYTFSSYHLHFTFISILSYTISFCAGLGQKEYSYPQERGKKETTSDHPINQRAATNSATSSYISYQRKSPNTPTDLPCQGQPRIAHSHPEIVNVRKQRKTRADKRVGPGLNSATDQTLENQNEEELNSLHSKIKSLRSVRLCLRLRPVECRVRKDGSADAWDCAKCR